MNQPATPEPAAAIALALLERWCDVTLETLGAAREEIDALNVYPVPDGDTGTNLYLTFEAARQAPRRRGVDNAGRTPDGLRTRGAAGGPRELRGDLVAADAGRGRSAVAR